MFGTSIFPNGTAVIIPSSGFVTHTSSASGGWCVGRFHCEREFDGDANVAIHRELVEAIAAGPGPRLEAAIAAHAPLLSTELS